MSRDRRFLLVLVMLTAVAALLRLYRLGDWSFSGDEAFTLEFSTGGFTWRDLRPLAFALNHYIAIPLLGPSELAIRLFPALFGIAVVPAIGLLAYRAYGRHAALWMAGLVALSPGLIGHSQFGRYYMQSFTVTTIVPLALLAWVRDRRWFWIVLAAACFAAGWFLVPSSSFIAPGLLLWVVVARRDVLGEQGIAWVSQHWRWLALASAVGLAATAWIALQVRATYMVGGLESGMRYSSPAQVVLGSVAVMGLPVAVLSVIGLALLPGDRLLDAPARWIPICWVAGSAAAFAGAYPLLAIGAPHVVSVLGVAFLAAGYACARLMHAMPDRNLAIAALGALLIPQVRELVSHFADGNHLDFRGAAAVVQDLEREAPGITYVLGHGNFVPYAPGLRTHEFVVTPDSLAWSRDSARVAPIRLVLSEHRRGLDVPEDDPLVQRALAQCRLAARLTRPRLDYYLNAVRVYDCPPRSN